MSRVLFLVNKILRCNIKQDQSKRTAQIVDRKLWPREQYIESRKEKTCKTGVIFSRFPGERGKREECEELRTGAKGDQEQKKKITVNNVGLFFLV